ncbi:MAG: flagellar protein FlgN [Lachnospiraceae bacterium]|jgi:hypothetical protein|nr:flagellar protein FlgN [Lachnospiraceae bacterium]
MAQSMQEPLQEYASVIEELTQLAGSISQIEEKKTQAAADKEHQKLDGYIQKEQALILKLRGLEQRRIRLSDSLGWESMTFRQILEHASPDQKEVLEPVFNSLEQQLLQLEAARKASEQIIHVRLHELQVLIARAEGGSYDESGNISLNNPVRSKLHGKYV